MYKDLEKCVLSVKCPSEWREPLPPPLMGPSDSTTPAYLNYSTHLDIPTSLDTLSTWKRLPQDTPAPGDP